MGAPLTILSERIILVPTTPDGHQMEVFFRLLDPIANEPTLYKLGLASLQPRGELERINGLCLS